MRIFLSLFLSSFLGLLFIQPITVSASVCTDGCQATYQSCDAAAIDTTEENACTDDLTTCEELCAPEESPVGDGADEPPTSPNPTESSTGTSAVAPATINLTNPLGTNDPRVLIGRLIQAIISISGAIALVMFVYAGLMFLTSAGNVAMVSKAKMLMLYTILGIIIIAGAFVATNTIFTAVLTGNAVVGADADVTE